MKQSVFVRLSIMMFLEFFIWGSWFVTTGTFMDTHNLNSVRAWVYSAMPIAAIISPFFLGMVADRFFASEKVLAVMSLLGGVAALALGKVAQMDNGTGDLRWAFVALLIAHTLCYAPTLGLTNTVAFYSLTDQEKQFPLIRVFGTLGWIASSGYVVSKWLHGDNSVIQYYVTAAAGVALGVFSFFLPHTPPPAAGKKASVRDILGLDALALMKSPSFAIFILSSLLTCIPLAAYFAYAQSFVQAAGFKDPGFVMSFGQGVEIFFMIVMPLFFRFLGVKWMLLMGMIAWVVRYGLFAMGAATGAAWMIVVGILLHGICYDFFFVTGFIYTDKIAAKKQVRGQAQGLLVLVTQGLGMFIGAQIAAKLGANMIKGTGAELLKTYQQFWIVPCIMATVVVVLCFVLFKDDSKEAEAAKEAEAVGTSTGH